MEKREGHNGSAPQLGLEKPTTVLPKPSPPPSSVSSSLGPGGAQVVSILWQRELTHLIKVSNEELCTFLNYCLSLLGNCLKWDFSRVSSFSLR